jgi:leucyl-tRNA synthetase
MREMVVGGGERFGYERLLHQTIKKITMDIDEFKLNTVVSSLMILVNRITEEGKVKTGDFEILLKLLSPLAPHLAEELWESLGWKESIFLADWPKVDEELAREEWIILPVQINGKLRDQLRIEARMVNDEGAIWERVAAREKVQKNLVGKKIKKKIYISGRIVSLVAS